MSFMYPLGLLALIGIPVIILIYILRNKYNEQTVTSTYIWKLSDKFLKRRNPLSGLTGIISLILQILMVAAIALAIARPVFVLPDAAYDYCFVLDASSSMQMYDGEQTRFQTAKDEIEEVIKDSKNGSSYTLICVADEAIVEFENVTRKDTALDLLEDVAVRDTASTTAEVLKTAQRVFDDNSSAHIYLITDKTYAEYENVEMIAVGGEQENYAIVDSTYSHAGGKLKASANVISYASKAEVYVALVVDGKQVAQKSVSLEKGVPTPVEFTHNVSNFNSFELKIATADAYGLDNKIVTYNLESDKTYSTLIVSETEFFLKAVIDAVLDSEVTVVTPKQYETVTEQYGLYIFDSYEPATLPDGAVWLINTDASIEDAGFSVRGKGELGSPTEIVKSQSTATDVEKLLKNVDGKGIYIRNYVKYSSMYLPFRTLFSCNSSPVIFAGLNGLGNRQVVFGFDFHEADFALSTDFVILMRNLLEYSFPDALDQTNYVVGDEALVNILANAEYAKAIAPSGKEIFIDTETAVSTMVLTEVGTYVVKMTIAGVENSYNIYVAANPDESSPIVEEAQFIVTGEKGNEKIDGEFDATTLLFIILAVLFVADWGVYCYEKYQLR